MQSYILIAVLALMVFSVALDLKVEDFRYVAKHPKAVLLGLLAQFALLPVATLLLTLFLDLPPAVEAAMLLVACCPGGALSNVITYFGKGNLALSLSISAVSNMLALVLTPLNFSVLIRLNPNTEKWLREIALNPMDLVVSLLLVLALPMALAITFKRYAPQLAAKLRKPLENFALLALFVFIVGAVAGQWKVFTKELVSTLPLVVAHNLLGLAIGYIAAKLGRLHPADARAVIIESGMQNSGLALGIIATQFNADISMVAVAGLWGIWHIISGGSLALLWRKNAIASS